MIKKKFQFSNSSVDYYFEGKISEIKGIVGAVKTVFITDENVFAAHQKQFKNRDTIVLKAGEEFKTQPTVDSIIEKLIDMETDRKTILVGVGGGVGVEATPLPPPPHAAVASIAALAISNFVNCFVLMAVLPKCLTKIRWGCVESLNLMCDDRHLMIV